MTLALFELERLPTLVGQCICGGPLPRRPRYAKPAEHCSYWCYLVEHGPDFYTLESIRPWLERNREWHSRRARTSLNAHHEETHNG